MVPPETGPTARKAEKEESMDEQLLNQLLEESGSMLVITLVVSVVCAVVCALVASRRNARTVYWAVMGLLFGPLAIPFVFFAKPTAGEK